MENEKVFVTGASSYIALHIIQQLLDKGYAVRATLRNLKRADHIREVLARHTAHTDRLEFAQADLTADAGWDNIAQGCTYFLHVASPFVMNVPKEREHELITPAVEGTRRALRAAAQAGVRRVVLTSSVAAVFGDEPGDGKTFDERSWTEITPQTDTYIKSKTLAEQAAWDFHRSLPPEQAFEMAAINPSYVIGPFMDEETSGTSTILIRRLLKRETPGNPASNFGIVDVRDVAAAHLAAMVTPGINGERFICHAGDLWMYEIAEILNRHFASRGYPVRTNRLPNFVVKMVGMFDTDVRGIARFLGKRNYLDTSKIQRMLGWSPRPMEQTVVDTAESMIRLKMV